MFEGIAAFLLNKYLGKYVADLDSENLNLGVMSGTVQLTDLQLKPEALYELDLPIEVKAGCIGKLSIDIPWSTLYTDPVLVHIEDVLILSVPLTDQNYDSEKEKRLLRSRKQKKLEDLNPIVTSFKDIQIKSQSFFENIFAQVINNVQISVQNVHVRYEDTISIPACAIACGVAFQGFTAITTNSRWKPSQIDASASKMFKLVKLETCYIYCNTLCNPDKLIKNDLKSHHWTVIMKESISNCSVFGEEFDFVLKPIIIKMKLIYNGTKELRVPKLLIDCVLQDASIQLSEHQYQAVMAIVDSFKRIELLRPFWKYRPLSLVKGNAKLWWHYAYRVVRDQFIQPYFWKSIKEHRQNYRSYKTLYKQRLLYPNDTEIRVDLQKAEDKLEITNIMLARNEVKKEIAKEEPSLVETEITLFDLPWKKLWTGKQKEKDDCLIIKSEFDNLWAKLSSEEKSKLFELVETFKDSPLAESYEDIEEYFTHKINFTLANCTLTLVSGERDILVASITHFLISCETRPSISGIKFSLRAESFLLEGLSADLELVPIITAPQLSVNTKGDVFSIDFEINPLHVDAHYALNVDVEPIEILYQQHSINEIINFFKNSSFNDEKIKNFVVESVWQCISLGKEKLLHYAMDERSEFNLNINFKSFCVTVAEGNSLLSGRKFTIDLGKLSVKSVNQSENVGVKLKN